MIDENPFFQTEHGFVRWDGSLRAVYSVVDGVLGDEEYQELMTMVLELAALRGSKRWLANHLKSRPLKPSMQLWTRERWVPMASKIGFNTIAALSPESALTRLYLERILVNPLQMRFFSDLSEAKTWLLES